MFGCSDSPVPAGCNPPSSFHCMEINGSINKRKRRPAGTPDPDAEVVSLSPKTLLESDRYVCEICNQGFQRDQNLQMHRRRHKVPWKLLKRETPEVRKRVFVCPEPSCLHHDPCHALGDLVGIKKHFRRKHSNHKQWVCEKCSKGYAVQSDYKAHLKTCGTRGHSCDCGRVFSRVESFIEHQDACNIGRGRPELRKPTTATSTPSPACLSRTASSPSPSSDTNFSAASWPAAAAANMRSAPSFLAAGDADRRSNLELQLLPSLRPATASSPITTPTSDEAQATKLRLSLGSACADQEAPASAVRGQAREQLRLAVAEKAYADEARRSAKREVEMAELELANAKRLRQHAKAELDKAMAFKEQTTRQINAILLHITCHACKRQFQSPATAAAAAAAAVEVGSGRPACYISSAISEINIGEGDNSEKRIMMESNS